MKKISWVWLVLAILIFSNIIIWLHFIYYEKQIENAFEQGYLEAKEEYDIFGLYKHRVK